MVRGGTTAVLMVAVTTVLAAQCMGPATMVLHVCRLMLPTVAMMAGTMVPMAMMRRAAALRHRRATHNTAAKAGWF